jgi:hypothetical protein
MKIENIQIIENQISDKTLNKPKQVIKNKLRNISHQVSQTQKNKNKNPNTNSFILKAFDNYKTNLNSLYNTYMNNPDYKSFINVLNTSIKKKKNDPQSNYRFIQNLDKNPTHIDLNSIFDEKGRNKIKQNFVNTLSSEPFVKEVKAEYKQYKNSNQEKIYGDINKFYTKEEDKYKNDEESKKISSKFLKSVNSFIDHHKSEYNQDGIITVDGHISTHPGDYIKKEEELLKKNYKEDNYSIEDIDKLMKFDKLIK